MKLIIGNKAYSSWSSALAGLLASSRGFISTKLTVPLLRFRMGRAQARRRSGTIVRQSSHPVGRRCGRIWDSLAILEYLADKVGRERYWPKDNVARGMARSLCAEMHSGYMALRRECPMNTRKKFENITVSAETRADAVRILQNWAEARSRFGQQGPYLFGTFSAADIMLAPVVTRFVTYGFTLPGFAQSYVDAMMAHPWMEEWYGAADQETWMIQRIEDAAT
jgi:glutathione S-transferase